MGEGLRPQSRANPEPLAGPGSGGCPEPAGEKGLPIQTAMADSAVLGDDDASWSGVTPNNHRAFCAFVEGADMQADQS